MSAPDSTPSTAQLVAGAAGIAMTGRRLIEATDQRSRAEVRETLEALHEHLAVAGGSLVMLAERLGIMAEVEALMREGEARLHAARACRGMEGRA